LAIAQQSKAQAARQESAIFQLSTWGSIFRGVYDGAITCGDLKQRGNFGIGAFDSLDGEMVVVDGKIFQVKGDGNVLVADDKLLTPFATVRFLPPTRSFPRRISRQPRRLQQEPGDVLSDAEHTLRHPHRRHIPLRQNPQRPQTGTALPSDSPKRI
jgi:acetolactate decarboxylase